MMDRQEGLRRFTQRAAMRMWARSIPAVRSMFGQMLGIPADQGGFTEAETEYFRLLERMFTALDIEDGPEDDWARRWAS